MEYRCISADCHIDLSWLPHDLFVSNVSQAMKDRMPYVAHDGPDGPRWTTKSGLNLGLANGQGSPGVLSGGGRRYMPGKEDRADRMAATGLFADGARGICRPTTPELRLQDQDCDGIQAEVIYGLHNSANKIKDREAALEFYRIYNEWLADFCRYDRKRLIGLPSIPCHDMDSTLVEMERVTKLGFRGIDISISWDMQPLWNPYWEPFWKSAADASLTVHFHTIGPRPEPIPAELPEPMKEAGKATRTAGAQVFLINILASVIHSGALERYPGLRIVLGESGIGWIPYVLDRMDYEFKGRYKSMPLSMLPSEYWRRQCRATFQDDRIGAKLLDDLGVETVMWGSDYPHPDGIFPDSQEYIRKQFGHLPPATQRRITCENAGKFYGLM